MSYTVKDLKNSLKGLPDDMVVVVQTDSEGNGYKECAGLDPNGIVMDGSVAWDMEVYDANWSAEDADMEDDEWNDILKKPRVLIIYPV